MIKDITGQKFNRLTAVSFSHRKNDDYYWNWICECGKQVIIRRSNVTTGSTKSCGCLRKEIDKTFSGKTKHGFKHTSFYNVWCAILSRCSNPSLRCYKDYGGRGIRVDWDSFEKFRDDMLSSYQSHVLNFGEKQTTIERIDNNANYSRDNCRWATMTEQGRNKRNNILVTHNGRTLCISEWAERLQINYIVLWKRLRRFNWSVERALTTPTR